MTDALVLENVSVDYRLPSRVVHAVRRVSLSLKSGEILGLLGASGSGKSTLLRAIAGLEPVASGRVLMGGRDVTRVPTHKRGIGMVFQRGELFPHRNVGRNISYGLEMAGVSRAQRLARVEELLELVGLAGYAERPVDTLSGGQAQRVALARTLAPRPGLVLLDEPLSALDKKLRERLAVDVRSILKRSGTAAIFVTHDPEEATTVSDSIVEMEDGELMGGAWVR
ncbi:Spermidine/putrescine import ATP-binding protein PotA [Corynebacterium guangdongense]|nr:Spermidine/putrescine import ATP-binding protein PotA [Corynebacterium guangdongense]